MGVILCIRFNHLRKSTEERRSIQELKFVWISKMKTFL